VRHNKYPFSMGRGEWIFGRQLSIGLESHR
jgi:hypothetical protein